MEQPNFSSLISLLAREAEHVSIQATRFVALPEDCDQVELSTALSEAGFLDEVRLHNSEVIFSLSTECWRVIPPVYQDEAKFWRDNGGAIEMPGEYFIVSSGASHFDEVEHSFINSVRVIVGAKLLLNKIADHYIPSETKALLFVSDESKGVKKTISYSLDVSDVLDFSPEDGSSYILEDMARLVEIDDPHKYERKEVLRRAVALILDESHASKTEFLWFLSNISRLKVKYDEQYEIYFHNFSASKLLNEIDQKSLEFNSKLMDFVSNSQNKALTIPGAIVAIAALIRIGGGWQIFLVMVGVLLVALLVTLFNQSLSKTYKDLRWQISRSFDKYGRIKQSDEVVNMADECQCRLNKKIDDAEKMLKTINFLAWGTFVLGVIYSFLVFFDLNSSGSIMPETQSNQTNVFEQQPEDRINQTVLTGQKQEDQIDQAVTTEQQDDE